MNTSFLEPSIIYAITGALTGIIAGVLGVGGGIIVVPALLYIIHHTHLVPVNIEMHVAAGTSLAIMMFTAQSTVRAHIREQAVIWPIFYQLWPGIIVGTVLGAVLAHHLPSQWLRVILGIVLLFVALKMLLPSKFVKREFTAPRWLTTIFSLVVGVKSGLLGIGGGTLIIPYLTHFGIERRKTAAISALCTLIVSVVGAISFAIMGSGVPALPSYSIGYIYWPAVILVAIPSMLFAPIGAHLTYVLPVKKLKYAFFVVLIIAAFELLT